MITTKIGTNGGEDLDGDDQDNNLQGLAGNDRIFARDGNDTLNGGTGNDLLVGDSGNDTYVYAQGDGQDTISEFSGNDRLILTGDALSSTHVRITRFNSYSAILSFDGVEDSINLSSQFIDNFSSPDVDSITFGDGVTWDALTLQSEFLRRAATAGDDSVTGFLRNDTLRGGLGNDTLHGGGGVDTVLFAQGDGQDVLSSLGSRHILNLTGEALKSSNVQISHTMFGEQSGFIKLAFKGVSDSISFFGGSAFSDANSFTVNFSDGVTWHLDDLSKAYLASVSTDEADSIVGFEISDTITAGLGNDSLNGRGGDDTYNYRQGDGHDIILLGTGYDSLALTGADLVPGRVVFSRTANPDELVLGFSGVTGSITLQSLDDQTFPTGNSLDRVTFNDGTIWYVDGLRQNYLLQNRTSGNDTIIGFRGNDTIDGGLGNDVLIGAGGQDVYLFAQGGGQDRIIDQADQTGGSYDSLSLRGDALLASNLTLTRSIQLNDQGTLSGANDLRLGFFGVSDSITVQDQFSGEIFAGIDVVYFSDNTSWDDTRLKEQYLANVSTTGNDTIIGFDNSAELIDSGLGNDLLAGLSGDDIYVHFAGNGQDTVVEAGGGGVDLLAFVGAHLTLANAVLSHTSSREEITIGFLGSTSDTVTLVLGAYAPVEVIVFDDELAWAGDSLVARYLANAGTIGDDVIHGFGTNDNIAAGIGNDMLFGYAGNDRLDGGAGTDTADYSAATGGVTAELWRGTAANDGQGGNDVLVGIENLNGGNFNDLLAGDEAGNVLFGADGNDSLFAGGGADTAQGGNGNDWLAGGTGIDNLNGGAGLDTADYASATAAVTAELWRGTASNDGQGGNDVLAGIENLNGGNFNDLLAGDEAANSLNGQAGNDSIFAGGGNDSLIGGNGNDLLAGGAGIDNLNGGAGIDTADYASATGAVTAELWRGTAANDGQGGNDILLGIENLNGGGFNDFLVGDEAANSINGAAGNDVLFGGGGADTLLGGNGNDFAAAGAGNDSIDGGSGIDTVDYASATTGVVVELWRNSASNDGQGGADVVLNFENLNGGNFNDFLVGNEGANVIVAGNGIDTVYGGGGDDFINGGNGSDILVGGAGRDIYRFDSALNAGSNLDTVTGFVVADDSISLARSIFGSVAAGTLAAGSLRAGAGVTSALDADDFILYNSSTGALYYDADGSGAALAVQFAVLPVGLALNNSNFVAG